MAVIDYTADIQKLYVAYFNRPADYEGLAFWNTVLNNGSSLEFVSSTFAKSPEYAEQNVGKSYFQIVNQIYLNLFNREADVTGMEFWADRLKEGTFTVDQIVKVIADNASDTDAKDKTTYANKVAAATAFTAELNTASEIIGYSGNVANAAAKTWLSTVGTTESLNAAIAPAALQNTVNTVAQTGLAQNGQTLNLTAGVDTIIGTSGNDTINAVVDLTTGATGNSFTALDTIDGATGNDTLNLNILNGGAAANTALAALPTISVANVEIANIRSAVDLTADVSAWSATTVNVTQGKAVNLTAASTAAVNVSGTTGDVDVNGGKSQNISVTGANVTSGTVGTATEDTTGNVTINVAKVADKDVVVTGGADVNVTTTGATTGNTINIGQGTQQPTGAVKVSVTGADYTATTTGTIMGGITVKGGTSIEVNQTAYGATAAAATDSTNTVRTQGAVSIDGAGTATTVTVNQSKAVAAKPGQVAEAGVNQSATYTFGALLKGQTMTVGGLKFTAAKDLTGAEVATAFAELTAGAVQGEGKVANGAYDGTFSSAWTSGTASGATVTFVAAKASTAAAPALTPTAANSTGVTGTLVQPTAGATVAGKTAVDAVTGVAGIANGTVTIIDSGTTDKIATVNLNGYATGSTISSDALTTLNVANSTGSLAVTNTVQKTLDLTVNGLATGASVTTPTYETINLHVAGASTFGLAATAAKALTVDGSAVANISTGTTFGQLESIVVKGTAGLNAGGNASGTLKSVDTTGTTGTVTVSIDGTKATYAGGAGVDNVTLVSSAAITKAVNLGAGDDSLTFVGTSIPTADGKINGGEGTNTLVLAAADAQTLSSNASFEAAISNFQKLSVQAVVAGQTKEVDLANLDDISYVISANGGNGAAETQTFAISHGTNAAVGEQQTFTVTGAVTGGTLSVGGVDIEIAADATAADVGAAIVAAKDDIIAQNGDIVDVTFDEVTGTVNVVYGAGAEDVPAIDVNAGTSDVTVGTVEDDAVAYAGNSGDLTIGATKIALSAGMNEDAIGAAIVAASETILAQNETIAAVAYDKDTNIVKVTYKASAGNVGNIIVATPVGTGAVVSGVTPVNGTDPLSGIALTIKNMANDGTLELTAGGTGATVTMTDATGTADSLNVKITNGSSINVGTVAAAGVETLKVELDDTGTSASAIDAIHTVAISDAALKSLVLTGDAGGIVTHNSNVITSINGSALSMSLTAGSLTTATVAATITGGSGDDVLTANHAGDTLIGGAGADTLKIGGNNAGNVYASGVTLTGGAGDDIFDISGANVVATVNDYATITDFSTGDVLQLRAANVQFVAAAVTTGGTAVFQDLVNKFIAESNANDAGWFVYQGDTYVVEHRSGDASTAFVNGTDNIVKIVGQVDLSNNASYSTSADTLLIFA